MKKEKVYTEEMAEEYAIKQYEAMIRRKQKSLRTKIMNNIKERGLPPYEIQYEFLKNNPNTELPFPELDHRETVIAWREAIAEYKFNLGS